MDLLAKRRCHEPIKIRKMPSMKPDMLCLFKNGRQAPCCAYDILLYENMMRVSWLCLLNLYHE